MITPLINNGPYLRLTAHQSLDEATSDPWGNLIKYNLNHNKAVLSSFGPDKKQGTEDDIIVEIKPYNN